MKKIIIIAGVIVLAGVGFWLFGNSGPKGQQVSKLEPSDVVKGFYDQWLAAATQPSVKPNRESLAKTPILSPELRDRLVQAVGAPATSPDPVLCQVATPPGFATRKVFVNADKAEILVTSTDKKVSEEALVSLNKLNEGWYINDIKCLAGEFAPEKEFTFEGVGYLLKDSIPAPYNKKNWHLIFEENGTIGNVVPILFDSKSQCTSLDEQKSVCAPSKLIETTKVSVHGQMTELGVMVNKMEFVK
ncbi:MAG: hypothetical protein V4465_00535 [Patescibacteria group bacterium]